MVRCTLSVLIITCSVGLINRDGLTQEVKPRLRFNDVVPAPFLPAIQEVLRNPTITTQAAENPLTTQAHIYDWLLAHPDRVSSMWRRLGVPCVTIKDLGQGRFRWIDDAGSDLVWQQVGQYQHGVIWYAQGKVKTGAFLPTIPVKAVAVLDAPRLPNPTTGTARITPSVHIYLLTDSRTARAALRVVGPAAPQLAKKGAEQLLLFFSAPAIYLHRHPDEMQTLLKPE